MTRRQSLRLLGGVLCLSLWGIGSAGRVEAGLQPDRARLRQTMQRAYGQKGLAVLEQWFQLLDQAGQGSLAEKLTYTNDFFNRQVLWVDDAQAWGQEDYWATPLETMGHGQGDCEDYAIAKYITLLTLGIPMDKLRMIYVRARLGRSNISQAHMVLGFYVKPTSDPLILDNIISEIQPGSQRHDLTPVFSFNGQGLWTGGASQSQANPVNRLSRWRNVLSRMQAQGFGV